MQPFKPGEREEILKTSSAAPDDLEEYERLLAVSFTEADPDLQAAPPTLQEAAFGDDRETRIRELHERLFRAAPQSSPPRTLNR
jgi:hypothetical protein